MRSLRALACLGGLLFAAALPLRAIPAYDHVVVVVLENHSYQEILNGPAAWLNRLRAQGANITGAYGIQHPSQPNYY
jgi:acid phosphatase